MMTKEKNKLLVIGNGFDKSLNLPTSYKDFLASKEFEQLYYDAIRNPPFAGLINMLHERNQLDNWVDVELEIKKFALEKSQQRIDPHFANILKKEFVNLKNALCEYLGNNTKKMEADSSNLAFPFLTKVVSEGISVINFNYTDTFKKALYNLNIR